METHEKLPCLESNICLKSLQIRANNGGLDVLGIKDTKSLVGRGEGEGRETRDLETLNEAITYTLRHLNFSSRKQGQEREWERRRESKRS